MHVVINGWYSGRAVGSGQYADALVAALRGLAGTSAAIDVLPPPAAAGALRKVAFEQWGFPRSSRGADVAHVPYWAPPLRPTVPTVVTVHDLIPLVRPEYRKRRLVRAYTGLVARATARAAAVIADSAHTAAEIRAHLPIDPERVHVVPLGVAPRFRPAAAARAPADDDRALRAALDLPPRFGLYLGGFDPRKNIGVLLAAWKGVHADTGVPLVIAGRAPSGADSLAVDPALAARRAGVPAGALRLVGAVPDDLLPALYRAAAVFAYPSRHEGFGLPPLEALACGTPVVAARATSLPEVVGDAAVLVDPDDAGAWARALRWVLDDAETAARLRAAGPVWAARFTWDATARRTWAVYEAVVAPRADRRARQARR